MEQEGAVTKKLRCYVCGFELTEKEDLEAAFEGMAAWQAAARARGLKPRGILPCKNYVRCHGEIVVVGRWEEWRSKLLRRRNRHTDGGGTGD